MELTTTSPSIDLFIRKEEVVPVHMNYKALLKEGIEQISQYAGEVWTNYNDSDPGITILQNLCYALTELGYKADLTIEDILANEDGSITYPDHFHTPIQTLPVNPITKVDFKKFLLGNMPELKQVYIKEQRYLSSFSVLQPFLEVKPAYAPKINDDSSLRYYLKEKTSMLLRQHSNITQIFTTPVVLDPLLLNITGTITLAKVSSVEKTIADVIFSINQQISPYPAYQRYITLVEGGTSLPELLDGPYLVNGYINDQDIAAKRTEISSDEVSKAILSVKEVSYVTALRLQRSPSSSELDNIKINFNEAPYITAESLKKIEIIENGQPVTSFDINKINYYLDLLTPDTQEGEDLASLLPKGNYYPLKDYYSIQNSFPSVYQLSGTLPANDTRAASIKQLKAYLVLFEQTMANYLAQLSHTKDLFSFESGRNNYHTAGQTYFTQPLYDVPGIDTVLKNVPGYSRAYADTANYTDWQAYQADDLNPYVQQLNQCTVSPETDLDRKTRALEHLLARYGYQYDRRSLQFVNPGYGDERTAEVRYLSNMLRDFPWLSANRIRTYFKTKEHPYPVCGMELMLGRELCLAGYYRGIVDTIRQSLAREESLRIVYYTREGPSIIYGDDSVTTDVKAPFDAGLSEIYWNEKLLLAFHPSNEPPSSLNSKQANEYLDPCLSLLQMLSFCHQGLILIDHNKLLELLNFQWIIKDEQGKVLFTSNTLPFDELVEDLYLINSELPASVEKDVYGTFEIGIRSGNFTYIICDKIASYEEASHLSEYILKVRNGTSGLFSLTIIHSGVTTKTFPVNLFNEKVSVFLPEFVSLFSHTPYKEFMARKIISVSPVSAQLQVCFLPLNEFQKLIRIYQYWITGIKDLQDGREPKEDSYAAAWELVEFLLMREHGEQ